MTTMQENNPPSKTQLKREADALRKMGKDLITLSGADWKLMQLPEILIEALEEARQIHSNNAQKRHLQYIGKLMRDIDTAPVKLFFNTRQLDKSRQVQQHHAIEKTRDTLISGGEEAVNSYIQVHPAASKKQLNHFVRQANREREAGHPPKSARALFRYLKELG